MSCCSSNAKCCPSSSNVVVDKPKEDTIQNKSDNQEEELRKLVRTHYANIVCNKNEGDCGSCFMPNKSLEYAVKLGYNPDDLKEIPEEANLGQGCGNPIVFSQMKPGEVVLDLGSGAGFDAFLAAKAVGENGLVIGVDMTPEMIEKSRENAKRKNAKNVQFRLGELEYLPVADSSVDVVISNCVINLVPNKFQVFKEVFRVLKSGGRLCISDTVTSIPLPESVRSDLRLFAGCIAGATLISDMEKMLRENGFCDIKITQKDESKEFIKEWAPGAKIEDFVKSAIIEAKKP